MVAFPASPAVNDQVTDALTGAVWEWDGVKWIAFPSDKKLISVGPTPPATPAVGDLWYDTSTNKLMAWNGSEWSAIATTSNVGGGFVNKLANGIFSINQYVRAAGSNNPPVMQNNNDVIIIDRWAARATGTPVPTFAIVNNQDFAGAALRLNIGTGTRTDVSIRQRIESLIASQLFTIDQVPLPVTVQVTIFNGTPTAITPNLDVDAPAAAINGFGTLTNIILGAAGDPIDPGTFAVFAYTFLPTADCLRGMQIRIRFPSVDAGYVSFARADLQTTPGASVGVNSNPPAAEMRDPAAELNFCARYFWQFTVTGGTAQNAGMGIWFPFPFRTIMRAAPTVAWSPDATSGGAAGFSLDNTTTRDGRLYITPAGTGVISAWFEGTISLTAEL